MLSLVGAATYGAAGFLIGYARFGGIFSNRIRTLRRLLEENHSIPEDFEGFLEEAVSLRILQRLGGGFKFMDRFFQDRFAALDPPSPDASSAGGT